MGQGKMPLFAVLLEIFHGRCAGVLGLSVFVNSRSHRITENREPPFQKKRKEKKETDKYYSSLFQCAASLFCTLIRKWLHCNPHFQQQLP
jgi:hypothetical protein